MFVEHRAEGKGNNKNKNEEPLPNSCLSYFYYYIKIRIKTARLRAEVGYRPLGQEFLYKNKNKNCEARVPTLFFILSPCLLGLGPKGIKIRRAGTFGQRAK